MVPLHGKFLKVLWQTDSFVNIKHTWVLYILLSKTIFKTMHQQRDALIPDAYKDQPRKSERVARKNF